MSERYPAEVFPPGEFLRDILEHRGWTQTEFAEIIGRPTRVVNEIIAAKRSVTPETARELAAAIGTSAQYWLNLESAYQLARTPPADERIAREASLRARFPVREMMKRGWIPQGNDPGQTEKDVLEFFELRAANDPIRFSHAARRNYEDDISELQWAWIFRVRQLARALQVPRYSEDALREALDDLERLMMAPEEVRHVPRILAECGVRFVVVEPIPGSKIQGVCFWLDEHSPVIALTLKGDFIDRFWFNLRHEIEHVLRKDALGGLVIDDFEEVVSADEEEMERRANEAAAEFCVPQAAFKNFIARHHPAYSTPNFIGFSRIVKRHPGIVAGQLQRRINDHRLFSKFQARIRSILIHTALTDGYGKTPVDI